MARLTACFAFLLLFGSSLCFAQAGDCEFLEQRQDEKGRWQLWLNKPLFNNNQGLATLHFLRQKDKVLIQLGFVDTKQRYNFLACDTEDLIELHFKDGSILKLQPKAFTTDETIQTASGENLRTFSPVYKASSAAISQLEQQALVCIKIHLARGRGTLRSRIRKKDAKEIMATAACFLAALTE